MLGSLLSPKASISLLAGLSGLGAALAGPVEGRQTTENVTVAMSTVTGYAHPLTLLPLTTLGAHQTPLSYNEPPTAIPVPTRRPPRGAAAPEATSTLAETKEANPSVTSQGNDALEATPVCTSIAGSYPTATIPNFCNPSAMANAPGFLAARGSLPTATVTIGAVSNKLDCCVQCAGIFNCVAWRFLPVYSGAPSPHLPGGFDPWGRGDCAAIYHTGNPADEAGQGVILDDADGKGKPANLCPNGKVGEVLQGNGDKDGNATSSWMNLYYDGWNEGPCAEPVDPFGGGYDAGRGDADDLCS